MVRREYPFSKRDFNKNNKLISSIIASIICLPFLSGSSCSNEFSLKDYEDNCGIRSFFPKFFINIIPNIILNILSIIPPILGLYFFMSGWWMFFSILLFGILDYLIYIIFIGSTKFYIEEVFIFDRVKLSKQIENSKIITRIDTCFQFVHIIIYLLFFYYAHLGGTDTKLISYLMVLWIVMLYAIPLFINSVLTWNNLKKIIYKNESYITIMQERKIISLNMLYELCDNRNEDFQYVLTNGITLKIINKMSFNIHQSGFLLCQTDKKEFFFCFDKYSKSFSDFLKNNNKILEKMLQDINYEIISYNKHKEVLENRNL